MEKCADCPYCQAPLQKAPQRKTKCPACGQTIHVKRTLDDPTRRLVTAEQAAAIEAQWQAEYRRRKYLELAKMCAFEEPEVERVKQTLQAGFPADELDRQAVFVLCRHALDTERDWPRRKLLAFVTARLLDEQGQDSIPFQHMMFKAELQNWVAAGCVVGVSIRPGDRCDAANRLPREPMPLEQALQQMPLPAPGCARGVCMCSYSPVFVGEST